MDDLEIIELTNNSTTIQQHQDTLSISQIINLLLSIFCIFGNAFLVYILRRNGLQKNNFYFIIINWSIANILFISNLIYFDVVPSRYISFEVIDFLFCANLFFITAPVLHATLLLFDNILKSAKLCRYIVYSIWCMTAIGISIFVPLLKYKFVNEMLPLSIFGSVTPLCLIILIVKILIHLIYRLGRENYTLRMLMSGICIAFHFAFFCTETLNYYVNLPIPSYIIIVILYIDGLINIILLVYLDAQVKLHFFQFFGAKTEYLRVHFTKSNIDTADLTRNEVHSLFEDIKINN